ncbi:uncharacterized protein LOC120624141 [Pararge aegeria]|uniref:Jg15128 protein n=1 Tax=Pararge aegeria aegeria TaxID=348720 RepID=A0A8S4R9F7_9NEOP|nr:uncharacterized protein LOC120624141 [Pararge aegeria]CAH2232108.1 jg15128 [Pararge aegeria aegeria]
MIIRIGFLLLVLTYVKTTDFYKDPNYSAYAENNEQSIVNEHVKFRKREAVVPPAQTNVNKNDTIINKVELENQKPANILSPKPGPSEGEGAFPPSKQPEVNTAKDTTVKVDKLDTHNGKNITTNSTANALKSNETISLTTKQNDTATSTDFTSALQNPGVVKRGLIVFGGFALLAVAYFVFYRRKGKKYDANNTHNTNDANQFRYGVLESEDRRDNLELSRIPLTMESDEDDEEDLEIFDLEQKRKSLSYVNLQTNDEDIVLRSSKDESKNNLLLDIEDGPSDTLINWSNTGSNSIL